MVSGLFLYRWAEQAPLGMSDSREIRSKSLMGNCLRLEFLYVHFLWLRRESVSMVRDRLTFRSDVLHGIGVFMSAVNDQQISKMSIES